MKGASLLGLTLLSFAIGALIARWGDEDALRNALRSSAPLSKRDPSAAKTNAVIEPRATEERFGEVLSAMQERSLLKQRHDLHEAIGDLRAGEIAALIERAGRLPAHLNYQITTALLDRWFDLDPERAGDWVRARPRDWHYWKIWATKAPERVIAEVHSQKNPLYRGSAAALQTAVATLAGPGKKAQASHLAALPADSARDHVLSETMKEWAKTDAAAAFAFARGLPAGALRQSIIEVTLREWANADPQRAAREVTGILSELAPGLMGNPTIATIAGALSKQDPEAALRWLSQLPEEQRGSALYVAAAKAWATKEPLAALQWCQENGMNARGRSLVMGAALESHPLETVRWVGALPAGEERNRMIEQMITFGGKLTFPPVTDAHARTVMELLPQLPPDAQERAAYQLGWASGHNGKLEDVRAWTERLTDPTLRVAAVEAAVSYRFGGNPDRREELLAQFPDGPERDGALAGIAAKERTPALAVQTALEIADAAMRHNVIDSFISNWMERQPHEARAWLVEETILPPDWKSAWLAELTSKQ